MMTSDFQKLSPWICAPLDRSSRAFLEQHPGLLSGETDTFMEMFIDIHSDKKEEQKRLRMMRHLLQDARARGGTIQAVREAYVNLFGGLLLDPPLWLHEIEDAWASFAEQPWTDRRMTVCKIQLKEAIERSYTCPQASPEMRAELQYVLGNFFANDFTRHSPATLQIAIEYYRSALEVYTAERYPLRCALIWLALGDVYRRLADNQRADLMMESLNYYARAMGIYKVHHLIFQPEL